MLNIKENFGLLLRMLSGTLDRKPVTNKEARMDFTQCVTEYAYILYSIAPLTLFDNSPLKKHQDYASKLDVLLGRYKMLGDEFLSDDKVDTFLSQLQNMMMDWELSDEYELHKEEKKYYTQQAWKNGSNRGTDSQWTWQEEKADTIKSAFQKHKDLAFNNLG